MLDNKNKEIVDLREKLKQLETSKIELENTRNKTIREMNATTDNIIKQFEKITKGVKAETEIQGGKRQKRNKKVTKKAKVKNNSKKRNKKTRSKKNKITRKRRN